VSRSATNKWKAQILRRTRFFAAHGFFAEQGFLAAHGLADLAAQGFFAAQGFDFWARAEPVVPRLRTLATTTAVAAVRTIRVTSFR